MILTNILVAGSAVYVGTKTYQKFSTKVSLNLFGIREHQKKEDSLQSLYAQGKTALNKVRAEKMMPSFLRLRDVDTILFSKSALTLEQPHVGKIYTCNLYSKEEILSVAAAAQQRQRHPIARAILQAACERGLDIPSIRHAQYKVRSGIRGKVAKDVVCVGSAEVMTMQSIAIPHIMQVVQSFSHQKGHELLYVAINNQLVGAIELCDTIRPEAKRVIRELKQRDYELVMISEEHEQATQALAQELGFERYVAETTPEKRVQLIEQLEQAPKGRHKPKSVCFVDAEINDAMVPQLSISLCGVSKVASDSTEIILMTQNLKQLVDLIDLGVKLDTNMKRTMLVGAVLSGIIVGGLFFLHLSLASAVALYAGSMMASMANTMWPLMRMSKV